MKVAFLGATRGMGRALARAMAARGDQLFLLGRAGADLEKSARDLETLRGGVSVGTASCDLERPETFAPALDAADRALGRLREALAAHTSDDGVWFNSRAWIVTAWEAS